MLSKNDYRILAEKANGFIEQVKGRRLDVGELRNVGVSEQQNIYYFPSELMGEFESNIDQRLNTHKLCNLNRPAISIKFSLQHQYATKNVTGSKGLFQIYIDPLKQRLKKLRAGEIRTLSLLEEIAGVTDQIEFLQNIAAADPDNYEIVLSSFFKMHYYEFISYQYFSGKVKKFAKTQLLTNRIKNGQELKWNIIFIDTERINEQVVKTSSKTEKYLNSFDNSVSLPETTYDLFVRKK